MDGRSGVLLSVLLLTILSAGCSRTQRALRSLKRAERSLEDGAAAVSRVDMEGARLAFSNSIAMASRAKTLLPEGAPLLKKAEAVHEAAEQRALTFESPKGPVLVMIEAMRVGDFPSFRLIMDLEKFVRLSLGEGTWKGLSAGEKGRLLTCVDATTKDWLEGHADHFRAMQQSIDRIDLGGEEASVHTTWRSTLGEIRMVYQCVRSQGMWRVYNFEVPELDTSLTDYLEKTVNALTEEFGSLSAFLSRDDAERVCIETFDEVESDILDLDDSMIGKTVALSDDLGSQYTVLKQTLKGEQVWLLVQPKSGDASGARWVLQEEAKLIRTEEAVWGLE